MSVQMHVLLFHDIASIAAVKPPKQIDIWYYGSMNWVIGIDEVGRGPLAGPVYVCAVAMPEKAYKKMKWDGVLNDSKQMSEKNREAWYKHAKELRRTGFIKISIASRTAIMVDKKGIAVCIRACIAENLQKLQLAPKDCIVLLDGSLKAPSEYENQQTIIKGDAKEKIISLASVVTKVQRDHYMVALHKKHTHYDWHKNKGYGTKAHISAIKKRGVTSLHRASFLKKLLQ
jgi:ribonuclease HII